MSLSALERAKALARQFSEEHARLARENKDNEREGEPAFSREATPIATPMPAAHHSHTAALKRSDTEVLDPWEVDEEPEYVIGEKHHLLEDPERKALAKRIIACDVKGNRYAAELMSTQLMEMEERERLVWEKERDEDWKIGQKQLEMMLRRRYMAQQAFWEVEEEEEYAEPEASMRWYEDENGASSSSAGRYYSGMKRYWD